MILPPIILPSAVGHARSKIPIYRGCAPLFPRNQPRWRIILFLFLILFLPIILPSAVGRDWELAAAS